MYSEHGEFLCSEHGNVFRTHVFSGSRFGGIISGTDAAGSEIYQRAADDLNKKMTVVCYNLLFFNCYPLYYSRKLS